MTGWNMSVARHIPEEELHAYLDQALSRSQCVEIERHLAECLRCQSLRDGIAGLRDRTTALLALIGPPPAVPPTYAVLERRHAEIRRQRFRRLSGGAWAASIAGAVLLGWTLNRQPQPPRSLPVSSAVVARGGIVLDPTAVSQSNSASTVNPAQTANVRRPRPRLVRVKNGDQSAPATFGFAQAVETDPSALHYASSVAPASVSSAPLEYADFTAQPVATDPQLAGLWRTVVPDSGSSLRTGDVPLVPGLAVVHMRVQPGHGEGDVTAVDQLLASGEMIRTISGPAGSVGALVSDNGTTDGDASQTGARVTVTIRQGDRMVAVTGPSDALGSLLSRVNTKRRY
jgi:anti-sigma factor RsiW